MKIQHIFTLGLDKLILQFTWQSNEPRITRTALKNSMYVCACGVGRDLDLKDKKYCCYDRFKVTSITFNEAREITALTISNDKGNAVYLYNGILFIL